MTPIRFGHTAQAGQAGPLTGVLHLPSQEARARHALASLTGVLLCSPWGQEAIRIHRLYRVLCERLARAGVPAMRFDYFGTGDALGDDQDGTLQRWQQDIEEGDATLRMQSGCEQVIWVGARLGGTLALRTARQTSRPPALVVAWAPIIDGPAYLRELAHAHVAAISGPFRSATVSAGERPLAEALGFGMSEALLDQIATLRPPDLMTWPQRTTLILPSTDTALAAWGRAAQVAQPTAQRTAQGLCTVRELDVPFEWLAEEAMNTALVPPAALQCLLDAIMGVAA